MRPALSLFRRSRPFAFAALFTVALGGCGGGGSSNNSSSAPPADTGTSTSSSALNHATYTAYTAPLARSVLALTDARQFASVLGRSVGGTVTAGAASSRRRIASVHPAATGLPTTYSEACDFGGTLQVVLDDRDGNGLPSAGDELTVVAANCGVDASGSTVNGGFTLQPSTMQVDGAGNLTLLGGTGSFNDFAVGPNVMNGGFSLSISTDGSGTETISFSFIDTTSAGVGPTIVQNTTFTDTIAPDGSSTFTTTGTLTIGGVAFTLQQPAPFVTPPGGALTAMPVSGAVQLLDASGNLLSLAAQPGDLLDFTLFIGGVLTDSLLGQPWSAFGG
jgi:hypothetical protein